MQALTIQCDNDKIHKLPPRSTQSSIISVSLKKRCLVAVGLCSLKCGHEIGKAIFYALQDMKPFFDKTQKFDVDSFWNKAIKHAFIGLLFAGGACFFADGLSSKGELIDKDCNIKENTAV